jgi:hypothetical protein
LKKVGFIHRFKAKGRYYYYLRKSIWKDGTSKKMTIYCFGNKEKAIENLNRWITEEEFIPEELKNLGFNKDDFTKWLMYIKKN